MAKTSKTMAVFGASIRKNRKKAGFTQKELAERADLTPNCIRLLERGQTDIYLPELCRIAAALGLRVSELCAGF